MVNNVAIWKDKADYYFRLARINNELAMSATRFDTRHTRDLIARSCLASARKYLELANKQLTDDAS